MADISQIGANIRILREQKGLTQRALADNVLVHHKDHLIKHIVEDIEKGLDV